MSSETEQIVLSIVPKVTGIVGVVSGIIVIFDIVRSHRKKEGNAILRQLCGASVFYMLDAFAWFLSSWVAPEGSFTFAHGNVASCSFQGFWLQAVIASPMYMTGMIYLSYLVACCGAGKHKLENIEITVHGLIFGFAIGTSLMLLLLDQYNHIGAVCWVNGSPPGCGHSSYIESDTLCDRGDNAWLFGLFTFYTPLWICLVSISCLNLSIYHKLKGEGASEDARWVANEAKWYALAFVITWAPSTVWSAIHYNSEPKFALDLLAAICEPLGGFFNLLVFLRSRPHLRSQLSSIMRFSSPTEDTDPTDEMRNKHAVGQERAPIRTNSSVRE